MRCFRRWESVASGGACTSDSDDDDGFGEGGDELRRALNWENRRVCVERGVFVRADVEGRRRVIGRSGAARRGASTLNRGIRSNWRTIEMVEKKELSGTELAGKSEGYLEVTFRFGKSSFKIFAHVTR